MMGTNYYWHPCEESIEYFDGLHIGKSSGGWTFALHVSTPHDSDRIPRSLSGWIERWQTGVIVDEYGHRQTPAEMLDIITNRGAGEEFTPAYRRDAEQHMARCGHPRTWEAFLRDNYAQEGPQGLLRCVIGGGHCIGHGDGTWDLITGTFS